MTSSNSNTLQVQECEFYQQWMKLQENELSDLLQALELNIEDKLTNYELTQIIEKTTTNFEDYMENRSKMAYRDPAPFFAPPWCTTLENSGMWLAGCRPSSYIRLVYALCGLEIEGHLAEYLEGVRRGDLADLSQMQLCQVDKIQQRTIKEENALSSKLATSQENMADEPLAKIAARPAEGCESDCKVRSALDENEKEMVKLLEEADKLRLATFNDLIGVLTPFQGVHFIAAAKKLRICIQEWGIERDKDRGRVAQSVSLLIDASIG